MRGSMQGKLKLHFMSYNLLADQCAQVFKFPYSGSEKLNFKFRSERIIEEIGSSPADIICLQEVDHIDDFYDEKLK